MSAAINISGKRFGNLVVVKRNGSNSDKKAVWLCLCDCGISVNKTYLYLKNAKELYCGKDHPTKICTKCGKEKNKETDYHKTSIKLNQINPRCKQCISEWYQENKDIIKKEYGISRKDEEWKNKRKEISKKSRIKNKHTQYLYKLEYQKRDAVKLRRKKIHAERKQNDVIYNIKRRLRWRIRDAVKRTIGSGFKYKSSLVLLGCDMDFFKLYIESKFTEGMNWQRIAYIHIDHIKPCSQFDLSKLEEQKKCFHYSNLQPLWEVDNLIKGTTYIEV